MTENLLPPVVAESAELTALRHEVRAYLADRQAAGAFVPAVDSWLTRWDPDFTRDLARQGWVGMTVPTEYGGHGKSFMERFVVTEELLAVGAPVAAHWVADRQIAPTLLRFGTEHQRGTFLPRIAAGECFFAIGMSEPDSGSDLASVRTMAERVSGGWRLSGTKLWTSGAHHAGAFFALARTAPVDPQNRHTGLSQFIVDLRSDDVHIRPIASMTGEHHLNEVFLDSTFVADDMVLGEIGAGWFQVTSELGFERSGPERFMSTFALWAEALELTRRGALPRDLAAGRTLARMRGMHLMSMAVSAALERGEKADNAAALVKVLGTQLEGDVAEDAHRLDDETDPAVDDHFRELLTDALLQRPGFTLRGGTSEILRGVIARGLGMR